MLERYVQLSLLDPMPPAETVQNRLSQVEARHRRDTGMDRAESHAAAAHAGWRESAFAVLESFLLENDKEFLAEAFVEWSRDRVAAPPDARAWGGIIQRARRLGLIERIGTAPAATSNLSPKPLWRKVNNQDEVSHHD